MYQHLLAPLTVVGETLVCVDIYTYLGSVISKDMSAQKDTKNRLSKARNTFANLREVWRSLVYSIRSKLNLYNSIVKSVLLNGSAFMKRICIRFRHFTMDAYAGSVGFSGQGPYQSICSPKQILSQFKKQLKGVVSGGWDIFKGFLKGIS